MSSNDIVRQYVRLVFESVPQARKHKPFAVRNDRQITSALKKFVVDTKTQIATALEEFIGLLPPSVTIDPDESHDKEAVVLTFSPARALRTRGRNSPYETARAELESEIKSIIIDELGYRRVPGRNSTFTRGGINVTVLGNTHTRDTRRDRDVDLSIPNYSVEFYMP